MSSKAKKHSQTSSVPELEPSSSSDTELEEALEEQADKTGVEKPQNYDPVYRQKNITKKAMTTMGSISLVAGSATAAAIGLGGALALDYCGEDEMYSAKKAKTIYNKVEDYTKTFDL